MLNLFIKKNKCGHNYRLKEYRSVEAHPIPKRKVSYADTQHPLSTRLSQANHLLPHAYSTTWTLIPSQI